MVFKSWHMVSIQFFLGLPVTNYNERRVTCHMLHVTTSYMSNNGNCDKDCQTRIGSRYSQRIGRLYIQVSPPITALHKDWTWTPCTFCLSPLRMYCIAYEAKYAMINEPNIPLT